MKIYDRNRKPLVEVESETLMGVDLRQADLQQADLRQADLRQANLQGANLQGANLQEADLWQADLRRVDLRRADLRRADLQEADLQGANFDFSCWPLWCGSIKVKLDSKQLRQLVYHALVNADDELKAIIAPELTEYANGFHRVVSGEVPKLCK